MPASRNVVTVIAMAVFFLSFTGAMSTAWPQVPQHVWSQRFGDELDQRGESNAVDGSGNVLVTGSFFGTVDFGGGSLTTGGSYNYDIFVAKFDAGGNHIWSRRFGDELDQRGESVAVDGSGNVLVMGRFGGTVDFGGGPLTSAGSFDIFVAKFDGNGNHLWSRRFGNESEQYVNCVTVDGSGNVIVTGGITGDVDFGGGPLTDTGSYDIFVAKFDLAGNHVWSQRFGGVESDGGASVTADGAGNVVVTGGFQDNVDFGGELLNSAGSWDIFVAKFDGAGNHVWSQRFGDADLQGSSCVTVDTSGNVVVMGTFRGTVDFGGGSLTSAGWADIYLVKFDGGGNHIWSQRFGNDGDQLGESIAVDGSGNVIMTGGIYGTADFGGGPLTGVGVYVVKFDGGGNHIWSQRFGSDGSSSGESVTVDGSGNALVTGSFEGTVDFGGEPLTSASTGGGFTDIFIAKFDLPPVTPDGFIGTYTTASDELLLRWKRCPEIDVSHYVVHEGQDPDFVPIPDNLLVQTPDTVVTLTGVLPTNYFKLGAVDSHGNTSEYRMLAPENVTVPTFVVSHGARWLNGAAEISWELFTDAASLGFRVRRKQDSEEVYRLLDCEIERNGNRFNFRDTSVTHGVSYTYAIEILNSGGVVASFTAYVNVPALSLSLGQNHPNPFNPSTTISFTLPARIKTRLSIYDVQGKLVNTLVDGTLDDGFNEVTWHGKDARGKPVSSGVYFYRLTAGNRTLTKKMVLLK